VQGAKRIEFRIFKSESLAELVPDVAAQCEDVHVALAVEQRVEVELVAPLVDDIVDTGEVTDALLVVASECSEEFLVDVGAGGDCVDSLIIERRQRVSRG
jgi:hypothetical protein